MINEVHGNMFKSNCQTLTAPVNMVGTMGNGLALYFKLRFPKVLPIYTKACRLRTFLENQLVVVPVDQGRQVLLFPTKNHWRDDSTIELIERYLKVLARDYRLLNIHSLAIPKLGCGKGNLDYDLVSKSLNTILKDMDIPVTVYI